MLATGIAGLQKAGIPTDLTSLAHMGFGAVSFSALVVFLPITSVSQSDFVTIIFIKREIRGREHCIQTSYSPISGNLPSPFCTCCTTLY